MDLGGNSADAMLCSRYALCWLVFSGTWLAQTNCSIFSKLDSLPILKGKSYLNNSYANNFGLTSIYIIKILKIPRSNLVVNFQLHPTISSLYIFLFSKSRDANLLFNFFSLAKFTPRPQIHLATDDVTKPPVKPLIYRPSREKERPLSESKNRSWKSCCGENWKEGLFCLISCFAMQSQKESYPRFISFMLLVGIYGFVFTSGAWLERYFAGRWQQIIKFTLNNRSVFAPNLDKMAVFIFLSIKGVNSKGPKGRKSLNRNLILWSS